MILDRIGAFLDSIGLKSEKVTATSGLLPEIEIREGRVLYTSSCHPGDLLHEAGHLALLPSRWRGWVNGDVSESSERIYEDLVRIGTEFESPVYLAVLQSGDQEVTAWAWAAAVHLDIPMNDRINMSPDTYQGGARDIRIMLQMGKYVGIHGLQHAGYCRAGNHPYRGLPRYPQMAFWAQP